MPTPNHITFMALPSHGPGGGSGSDVPDRPEPIPEYLEPVVAGARARGVADAFEMLGIEAILLDSSGKVLHAGRNVAALLAPAAWIADGHLIGRDRATQEALQGLIAAALTPPGHGHGTNDTVIGPAGKGAAVRLRTIRCPSGQQDRFQLLRAVLAVAPSTD